jgi:hypothetical protein
MRKAVQIKVVLIFFTSDIRYTLTLPAAPTATEEVFPDAVSLLDI